MPEFTKIQQSMLETRMLESIDLLVDYFVHVQPDPKPYHRTAEIIQRAYQGEYKVKPIIDKQQGILNNLARARHLLCGIFQANFSVLEQHAIVNNPRDTVQATVNNFSADEIRAYAVDFLARLLEFPRYASLAQVLEISNFRQVEFVPHCR